MNPKRRNILKGATGVGVLSLSVAAGLLKPTQVLADWNAPAFDAKSADDALAAAGGTGAQNSDLIKVDAPDIAENGASVPVNITVNMPDVDTLMILADKNVYPLIVDLKLTDFGGFYGTRIKMAQTAPIRAVVKAGGKLWMASKEVKVTIGGCGG
jgi:sulfur-oxidizing protein SoxY